MKHAPGFLKAVDKIHGEVREITVHEVRALQTAGTPFVFLDVREDDEWRSGHAAGAVHIGRGVIERDIETQIPDPHTPLILYCGGGYRSTLAAKAITDMGYTDVRSMIGGIKAWRDAGFPEQA